MSDTVPMPAYDKQKGPDASTPDGVNDVPNGAGEGGAYPNPHTGKTERGEGGKLSGFMGHGGQSEIAYSGPDNTDGEGQVNAGTSPEAN